MPSVLYSPLLYGYGYPSRLAGWLADLSRPSPHLTSPPAQTHRVEVEVGSDTVPYAVLSCGLRYGMLCMGVVANLTTQPYLEILDTEPYRTPLPRV